MKITYIRECIMSDVEVKNTKKLSKNDTVFYRLLLLFVYAVVSLVGINIVLKYEIDCRKVFSSIFFIIGALLVFAFCVFVIIKKFGENNIIRWNSIAKVVAPVFLMLAIYTNIDHGNFKTEIVIIASVILGFIFIVYPKAFYFVSIAMVVEYFSVYYVNHSSTHVIDKILNVLSYPIAILVPVCAIVLGILLTKGKLDKVKKILNISKKNAKLFNIMIIVLGGISLVCALLAIFLPVTMVVLSYVLLGVYILAGVIGTIKLI